MKSLEQKRVEAYDRLVASSFEDSKAKRLGKSQDEWLSGKEKRLEALKALLPKSVVGL